MPKSKSYSPYRLYGKADHPAAASTAKHAISRCLTRTSTGPLPRVVKAPSMYLLELTVF